MYTNMSYAAYKVSQGIDYRYPWIAELLETERSRSGIL